MAVRAVRGPAALAPLRTVALAIGFLCAAAASVIIFVTENATYLRIGILVALWGFVFAALAAGRRQTEQAVAASTEIEVRKSYEFELEREVAARREYELRLEAQLRRELQEGFTSQVGALHEEMTRLRRELSEQWDSELRVERMVMRTQSVRMGGERRESLQHGPSSRPSIDAAPLDDGSFDAGPSESSFDDGPTTMEVPGVAADEPSVPTAPVLPTAPGQQAAVPPAPVPTSAPPSYGFPAPVPTSAPPSSGFPILISTTPRPIERDAEPGSVPQPGMHTQAETAAGELPAVEAPGDVLGRILAEAGVRPGGRRSRHRHEDEE